MNALPTGLTRRLLPWGYWAAFAACALNAIWLGCLVALVSFGDVARQAGMHPALFRTSVGSALLITIAQVPLLLATTALAAERDDARALVGGLLYALYVPVNLIGYFSYGRLAPIVHSPPGSERAGAPVVAMLVEIGHPLGLTGNLPVLGYGLLGLAWCLLSTALWSRGRLWRIAVPLWFTSGLLSVVGAIGAFVDVPWLATGCFLGGVVSFPALAMIGVAIWKSSAT
jgi:hypothetical protein